MPLTEQQQTQLDDVMDRFNFELVQKAMAAADWEWARLKAVPKVVDLRQCARDLLKRALETQSGTATGGLFAYIEKNGTLRLEFVMEWQESEAPSVHDFATRLMEERDV